MNKTKLKREVQEIYIAHRNQEKIFSEEQSVQELDSWEVWLVDGGQCNWNTEPEVEWVSEGTRG